MAKSQELFEQIKELFTEFESEHNGTSKDQIKDERLLEKSKN